MHTTIQFQKNNHKLRLFLVIPSSSVFGCRIVTANNNSWLNSIKNLPYNSLSKRSKSQHINNCEAWFLYIFLNLTSLFLHLLLIVLVDEVVDWSNVVVNSFSVPTESRTGFDEMDGHIGAEVPAVASRALPIDRRRHVVHDGIHDWSHHATPIHLCDAAHGGHHRTHVALLAAFLDLSGDRSLSEGKDAEGDCQEYGELAGGHFIVSVVLEGGSGK